MSAQLPFPADDPALVILSHLFAATEVENETLITLRNRGKIVEYEDGTMLCSEGEVEEIFYVLLEGQVEIYRTQEGESILIDTLHAGTCFGELALILHTPRSADVIADGKVKVLEMDRSTFDACVRNDSKTLLAIAQFVITRMLKQEELRLMQLAWASKGSINEPLAFVSYARADADVARKLVKDLHKHKVHAWIDIHDIRAGKSWARQIGEALDRCKLMILLLSPAAIKSGHVDDEWNYYLDKGKPILPVLVQPCEVPYRLHKLQYVDFTTNGGDLTQLVGNLRVMMLKQDKRKTDEI
ncbi:MAG: TIR domain-containing protein [Anaerolineae bacterium]